MRIPSDGEFRQGCIELEDPGAAELADIIQRRLEEALAASNSLEEFTERAHSIGAEIPNAQSPIDSTFDVDFALDVIKQLDYCDWKYFKSGSSDMREMLFQLEPKHISESFPRIPGCLELKMKYNRGGHPSVSCNFPSDSFSRVVGEKRLSLCEILDLFEEYSLKYTDFWSLMADLDEHTYVVDPEEPKPESKHRQIFLGNGSFLSISVDPDSCRSLPRIRIAGSDRSRELKERANLNLAKWDPLKTLRGNLECLLEIKFPRKSSEDGEEDEDDPLECGICCGVKLDGKIPDVTCSNIKCPKMFHSSCLYEVIPAIRLPI